jgi:hypothetical protein
MKLFVALTQYLKINLNIKFLNILKMHRYEGREGKTGQRGPKGEIGM